MLLCRRPDTGNLCLPVVCVKTVVQNRRWSIRSGLPARSPGDAGGGADRGAGTGGTVIVAVTGRRKAESAAAAPLKDGNRRRWFLGLEPIFESGR
jgi:hypothetical protein